MTRPRKALISLADTPYYHITSRCVPKALRGQALRRAFLCGVDHYSGQNYEHRRQWVVDRIRLLNEPQTGILFNFEQYLALVDWTGRIIRSDKHGHIDSALPPILNRLGITADQWCINTTQFEAIHPRRFNRIKPQLDTV